MGRVDPNTFLLLRLIECITAAQQEVSMKTKIIIVGGGYAGIRAAKVFGAKFGLNPGIDIQLIDKNPYHTLMTELHEVAGGRIDPDALRIPLADIFHGDPLSVVTDEIKRIDFDRQVLYSEDCQYPYDFLILATGSKPAFFGIQGVASHGFTLCSYKDAVLLRDHIENCFYHASHNKLTRDQLREKLTFIIAGGGFTGVEMAGELAEWKKRLCRQYSVPQEEVRLILVEASQDILQTLDSKLRVKCLNYLKKSGISLMTGCGIKDVEGTRVRLSNDTLLNGTLIWTAGIQGNPFLKGQPIQQDPRFRIQVDEHLQSKSHPRVFSAGDAMAALYQGKSLPQVVETAVQSGEAAARNIVATLEEKPLLPFRPKYHGTLISVGSYYVAAKLSGIQITGIPGLCAKHLVHLHHIFSLGGFRFSLRYLHHQFIYRFSPDSTGFLSKQITQFLDPEC